MKHRNDVIFATNILDNDMYEKQNDMIHLKCLFTP